MTIRNKLAIATIATTVLVPSLGQAHGGYTNSPVLDARGNAVTTTNGHCVVHDFPEAKGNICNNGSRSEDVTVLDEVVIPNVVYFNLDKSTLNSRGKKVIDEVAKGLKELGRYSVQLSGFADRSAGNDYNKTLSQKRVQTVKSALVSRGVAGNKINTRAFGEGRSAVPTADGVVEALNRRVEIEVSN